MTKTIAKLITSRQMKSLSTLASNRQLAIESSMLSEDECAEKLRAYDKQWKSVEQRIGHKIDPVAFQIATNCALHECPREQLQQRMQDVFDADDAARNAEPTHEEKREALRIEALQGDVIMPQSHDYDGLVELCKRAARAQCAERQMINADGMDFEPLRRMASRAFDFLTAMQKAEAVKFDSEEQTDGERNFTRDELNANAARRAEQRAARAKSYFAISFASQFDATSVRYLRKLQDTSALFMNSADERILSQGIFQSQDAERVLVLVETTGLQSINVRMSARKNKASLYSLDAEHYEKLMGMRDKANAFYFEARRTSSEDNFVETIYVSVNDMRVDDVLFSPYQAANRVEKLTSDKLHAAAKFSAEERALNTASKIGSSNAAMAHDQRDGEDYATPQHVFVAYYQNVIDTANEYRVDVDEAVAAYVAHYDKMSK